MRKNIQDHADSKWERRRTENEQRIMALWDKATLLWNIDGY